MHIQDFTTFITAKTEHESNEFKHTYPAMPRSIMYRWCAFIQWDWPSNIWYEVVHLIRYSYIYIHSTNALYYMKIMVIWIRIENPTTLSAKVWNIVQNSTQFRDRSGFHSSINTADPDQLPHAHIRLYDQSLRDEGPDEYIVLHWRPGGRQCRVLPRQRRQKVANSGMFYLSFRYHFSCT
jgi:hypothetical protein